MTATATLDIQGDLVRNPLAELLVEISQAKLSGSLRLSNKDRKAVVYLKTGRVVHAVSNQRDHRLFTIGLERNKFTKEILSRYPNFANDIEFAASLKSSGQFTEQAVKELSVVQIEQILIDTLSWPDGEWVYSPHARLRNDLVFDVDAHRIMIDFARCMPGKSLFERFRSVDEVFGKNGTVGNSLVLQPHEKYVLDRFEKDQLSLTQLRSMSTLPESGLLQAIYALWLGGILIRREWTNALSTTKLDAIRTAKFAKVNTANQLPDDTLSPGDKTNGAIVPQRIAEIQAPKIPEPELSLDEYLEQVDKAVTHYDLLGVSDKASLAEIKTKYFTYAKSFHPDRFHREESKTHSRIQNAFTQLAHAYETLKTDESRETYDYKVRKELEIAEKRRAEGRTEAVAPEEIQAEKGLESFEAGLELYQDEDYAAAATHLARAVHYSPQNALYHAYFGKALSYTGDKYRHQAESELQAAVRIDPKNAKIRMMLVEFFTDMNMNKRAIGELNRFLDASPGNREAKLLLQKLTSESPV
jgi:curved DNA-binding protein CbpA